MSPSLNFTSVTNPPTRALTNLKGVRTMIYAAPKSKPDILYIGLNDRDPRWHDLYELHLSTGEKTLVRKNTEQIAGWVFDHDGTLRLAERTNQAGDTEILRVDPAEIGMSAVRLLDPAEIEHEIGAERILDAVTLLLLCRYRATPRIGST